jgi:F1F0 ATPase subunit 2
MITNFLSPFIGAFLGCLFFGGLWFTIKKSVHSSMPGLLFLLSFLLRTALVVAGFYFLARLSIANLIFAVIGFMLSRPLVGYLTKPVRTGGPHEA